MGPIDWNKKSQNAFQSHLQINEIQLLILCQKGLCDDTIHQQLYRDNILLEYYSWIELDINLNTFLTEPINKVTHLYILIRPLLAVF